MSKKPTAINTQIVEHRVRLLGARHSLLSEGMDEHQANAGSFKRALDDWEKWDYRYGTLVAAKGYE